MYNIVELASHTLVASAAGSLDTLKDLMSADALDIGKLVFFQRINEFMKGEIQVFSQALLGRSTQFVTAIASVALTVWIMFQGFRIVTGQSRDSMMGLVVNSLKATLIISFATGMAFGGKQIDKWLTDDVPAAIYGIVSAQSADGTDGIYKNIDRSLGYMQIAFSSIDALQDTDNEVVSDQKNRAMWFAGVGTGGPAITAGVMMLLNRIAMALFIGLGPFFIMCLLFEQTKQFFSNWLFYGIGTMFALAVLSVMVTLATDVIIAVAASFWVGQLISGNAEGVNSMAMQQGGLGLLLTMLIISTPPIAAGFFRGVMGNFAAYSSFGNFGGAAPGTRGTNSPPVDTTAAQNTQGKRAAPEAHQSVHPYTGGMQADSTDTQRNRDQSTRGIAGAQQRQLAGDVSQTIGPQILPSPQIAGGPPRGGTA